MKYLLYSLLAIAGIIFLLFLSDSVGLIDYKFFAPKYENARRQVFEQTQSYVEGKRQELTKYRLEYEQCKTAQDSEAIRVTILSDFANFDYTQLPPDLQSFLSSLK